jgi:hypothetical protein
VDERFAITGPEQVAGPDLSVRPRYNVIYSWVVTALTSV